MTSKRVVSAVSTPSVPRRSGLSPALRRFLALLSLACFAFALTGPVTLTSCSGDKETSAKKKRGNGRGGTSSRRSSRDDDDDDRGVFDIADEAKGYLEEAEEAGAATYFADAFKRATEKIEDGDELLRDGDSKGASRKYKLAARQLKGLVDDARKVAETIKTAEGRKKTADEAKQKADEANAEENSPEYYRDAVAAYESATSSLSEKNESAIRLATAQFTQARELFLQATLLAAENEANRDLALQEKGAMTTWKAKAKAQKADELALQVWQIGEQEERRGAADLKRGDFRAAITQFKSASRQYLMAFERVGDETKFKEAMDQAEKARQEYLAKRAQQPANFPGGLPNPVPLEGGGETGGTTATPVPSRPVELGSGMQASCFDDDEDFNFEDYPNQLDYEDEEFLQTNLHYLSPTAAMTYDPVSGQVLLNYSNGRKVKKEAAWNAPKKHIEFEDRMMRDVPDSELDDAQTFAFGGNTRGSILFPVPFRYRVRVDFRMMVGTMTSQGRWGVIVNYDEKSKRSYRSNFLAVGRGSKMRGMPGDKFARHPNYWHDKTSAVPWRVEFRMPDLRKASKGPLKSARFTATYEFQRDEEASNSLSSPAKSLRRGLGRGLVGFHWVAVKFRIRELHICGIMDKEAAVAKLRKMLDQPKEAPGATGQDEGADDGEGEDEGADDGEGEGEDEPPENPTAPDDGGGKKSKPIDDI
ncbi:MAG: hypothetical protein O7J95_04480 [Planctomycetota bacterium]|nr:hypothetical protein [Planctomycetota bacterium]